MAAKLIKYTLFGVAGLIGITLASIIAIDDSTIEHYGGGLGETLVDMKHGVGDSVGGMVNAVGGWTLNAFGGSSSKSYPIPSVVQSMPPPPTPETVAKPVESKSLAEVAAETQQLYDQQRAGSPPMNETALNDPTASPPAEPMPSSPESRPLTETSAAPVPAQSPPPPAQMTETAMAPTAPPDESPPPAPSTTSSPETASPPDEAQNDDTASIESMLEEASAPQPAQGTPSDDPDPMGDIAYTEGLKYYLGQGVERNFGTAAQYFIEAAERGHPKAQYNLGLMNYVGQTGGQDFANAAKWFERAAASGHILAQYNLGFLYYEGKGVRQDLKTAYGWIDRAAQQGYPKAIKARDALKQAMPEVFGG